MDEDPIPPLLPPDEMPAVHRQEDLHRHWRALMGTLGFARRSLWLQLVAADRQPTPLVVHIDEAPDRPEPDTLDSLMVFISRLLREEPGGSAALLLARPGPGTMTQADLDWARALTGAARRWRIPLDPLHLATDEAVRVFAPDDLVERRPA